MNDNEISKINQEKLNSINEIKTSKYYREKNSKNYYKLFNTQNILILIMIILQLIIIYALKIDKHIFYHKELINTTNNSNTDKNNKNLRKYDTNFNYEDFDTEIITEKIIRDSGWIITLDEARFINGIIRKNKLKNLLEIGVAHGGSSVLMLNAIKDFEDSILVSLDLNKELYDDPSKLTGYRVNQYFPELTKNWKLCTGDQPHKFLVGLNKTFDFLFLDTAHISPGEIINIIEALPFLNENAIVVIHDILLHFSKVKNNKFFPSCISLLPTLFGDKIFLNRNRGYIQNIGAVFLYPNQEEHYLDYFLLLLNFWEYIPTDDQLNDLRIFINKYYKNKFYTNIFNVAVNENKKANNIFMKYINSLGDKNNSISQEHKRNFSNYNYMKNY